MKQSTSTSNNVEQLMTEVHIAECFLFKNSNEMIVYLNIADGEGDSKRR